MKISELWLREWVNPQISRQELASQLTMAGLEIEAIIPVAPEFSSVVVALVKETAPHPDASKLTVCVVDAGLEEPLQIVCGAQNVRAGLITALALPGASLPNNIKINETKLRGVVSQGMLCSAIELGIEMDSEGIIELPEDAPVGTSINNYLQLDDVILEISLTPNRADCLSVIGVAREVAALNQLSQPLLPTYKFTPTFSEQHTVKIEDSLFCPRYCAQLIRGIPLNKKTPLWMLERLRRSGIRPIHPLVDIANYVMLELGQPLHAFDIDQVDGPIVVRSARENETIVLLNGQSCTLQANTKVIADNTGPLAIAGVMGAQRGSVNEETTNIWIESAYFSAPLIAGIARKYGLCTDASQRFERGVDPNLPENALARAVMLILELLGGEASNLIISEDLESIPKNPIIEFDPSKVQSLTGLNLDDTNISILLKSVGLEVNTTTKPWKVKTPSFRVDLSCSEDLVEEVARLYGYDHIPSERITAPLISGNKNTIEDLTRRLRSFWSSHGYSETINFSFVDPQVQGVLFPETPTMQLLNPISSELSQMRLSLWPGLLATFIHNIHRQQSTVKIFEAGSIFAGTGADLQERPVFAGLLAGMSDEYNWRAPTRAYDFYDLKAILLQFFTALGLRSIKFVAAEHPSLHPGQSAKIEYQGNMLGWMGLIHPRIADAFDWDQDVFVFEITMDSWPEHGSSQYKPISKFPKIRRDLALIVPTNLEFSEIETCIRASIKPEWLKSLLLFDVYRGPSIPKDKKSLAVALIFQDDDRTLIDDEIKAQMDGLITRLFENLSITLRE